VVGSYRLGVRIILGTILISAGICLVRVGPSSPAPGRAAEDLRSAHLSLGEFELVERSRRKVTQADLAGRVVIASFIFTRCPLSCPRISSVMKTLQDRLAGTDVLLLSISVDPDHDTTEALTDYARRFEASPDRWWFLTGPKPVIYHLVRDQFKLSLMETPPADPSTEVEAILHSDRLALVDRNHILGLFDSNDSQSMESLIAQARRLAQPRWVGILPTVNACLNALSAGFLLAGWVMIRRYRIALAQAGPRTVASDPNPPILTQSLPRAHAAFMALAFTTSTMFLASYLVYHWHARSVSFPHGGWVRLVYLTVLLSHTILAAVSVPLILLTIAAALRGNFARHFRIAPVTYPIWLYVAATGVLIYAMLYLMPVAGSRGQ
jgi:protein SCO1/2/putative membrane protein